MLAAATAFAGQVTYYHNDLAGSPVAATNASGQVIWRESYRPYGERLTNAPASSGNKVWFTSRRQDAETGLVYMGARYYDPVAGRFTSVDPVSFVEGNVHSFNRYAYANNNPYRYKDPTGNVAETIWDLASFAISVAIFKNDPTLENFLGAAVDGIALAIPFVPGGVGATRAITAGASEGIQAIAGGGAKLDNISSGDLQRIQNAADRTGIEVSVVGSRASGTSGPTSDWDYILKGGTVSERHSIKSSLPEGSRGMGEPRNQDFLKGPVDGQRPFITVTPR